MKEKETCDHDLELTASHADGEIITEYYTCNACGEKFVRALEEVFFGPDHG